MKKSLKKITAALLAGVIVCGAAPVMPGSQSFLKTSFVADAADETSGKCGENLTWKFDTNTGVLTFEGTGVMIYETLFGTVPWADYLDEIKEVIIPEGVISIADKAFKGATNLTDITFPSSCIDMGLDTLQNCPNLKNVTFLNTITRIPFHYDLYWDSSMPDDLFHNWGISNNELQIEIRMIKNPYTDIAEKVPYFGNYPQFNGTIHGIKGSYAEDFAKGYCAFDQIPTPTSGYCGEKLKWRFDESSGTLIIEGVGEMLSKPWEITYKNKIKKITITEGVTKTSSFYYYSNLQEITYPSTCEDLGESACQNCPNLKKVTILNPDAKIRSSFKNDHAAHWAISNNQAEWQQDSSIVTNAAVFNGTIYGYKGSTAEKLAKDYCKFETIKESSGGVQRSALRMDKDLTIDLYADLSDDVATAYIEGEDGVTAITDFSDKKITEGENAGLYRLSYVTKPDHTGSPITLRLADKDGNFLAVTSSDSDVKADSNSASITVDDYVRDHYSADDAEIPWLGDPMCDNTFTADDASYTLRAFTLASGGKHSPTAFEMSACDVNKDGKITADDASLILRYYTLVSSGKWTKSKYEYFNNPV